MGGILCGSLLDLTPVDLNLRGYLLDLFPIVRGAVAFFATDFFLQEPIGVAAAWNLTKDEHDRIGLKPVSGM